MFRGENDGVEYTLMSEEVLLSGLSRRAIVGWGVIASFADEKGEAVIDQATVAHHLGCSTRSLREAVAELEAAGYMKVVRVGGRRSNRYRPLPRPTSTVRAPRMSESTMTLVVLAAYLLDLPLKRVRELFA